MARRAPAGASAESFTLRGTPVQALARGVHHAFFPALWAAVGRLTTAHFPAP